MPISLCPADRGGNILLLILNEYRAPIRGQNSTLHCPLQQLGSFSSHHDSSYSECRVSVAQCQNTATCNSPVHSRRATPVLKQILARHALAPFPPCTHQGTPRAAGGSRDRLSHVDLALRSRHSPRHYDSARWTWCSRAPPHSAR